MLKNSVAIPDKLIFRSGTYTPGRVNAYIEETENYDTFVGLDFGDGVCTVYKAYIKSVVVTEGDTEKIKKQWVIEEISVKDISVPDGVPTALVYKDNEIIIGKAAHDHDNIYHQFKFSPDKWDKNYNGRKIKELIRDFLSTLWNKVLESDPMLSDNGGKTLVIVGHPGGSDWSCGQNIDTYRDLLKEIFNGCGVGVMAEPFAAVFGAVRESVENKKPLCITDGIFIDEHGSSTGDTCYVMPGNRPFTDSVNCAGRDIDRRMFVYLVRENGEALDLVPVNFEPNSVSRAICKMKDFKEEYCSNPTAFDESSFANIRNIDIVQTTQDGSESRKKIEFHLNRALLDSAINMEVVKNTSLGAVTKTWLSETEAFLKNNKSCIGTANGKLRCKKLILAGGTSKVPQIEETVRRVFEAEITADEGFLHKSENPTQLVAKGLAYKKVFERRVFELSGNFDNVCGVVTGKGYDLLCERFSEEIAKIKVGELKRFCKEFLETPAAKRKNYSRASFNGEITSRILKTDTESLIRPFRKIFFEEFENIQKELKNRISPILNIAFGLETSDAYVVNIADMKTDLHTLNAEGEKILESAVMTGIRDTDSFEWMFSSFREKTSYLIKNIDEAFCIGKLNETGNKSGYERKVKQTGKSVIGTLFTYADNFSDLFKAYMTVQTEIYLGKALLLIWE